MKVMTQDFPIMQETEILYITLYHQTKPSKKMDKYNYNETEDYLVINLLVKATLVFGFLYLCNLMN